MVWKDFNVEQNEEKLSRINAAGIINITLENLWRDRYSALCKGDLVLWNRKLDAIWVLLCGDVKKDDDADKNFNKLDLQIYETGGLNHKKSGFERLQENEKIKMAMQYHLLREKSKFLRRLQNLQGKGTAYAVDEGDWE